MQTTRDIKRRLKSIGNIKQITRAMQLVAGSKMRKAQTKTSDADAYAYGALEILENITRTIKGVMPHPYWQFNQSSKTGLILISTDRGFCGGMNVNLFSAVLSFIKQNKEEGQEIKVVTVGKKARDFVKKLGLEIIADFSGINDYFTIQGITPIASIASKDYLKKEYKDIYIAFTQFINTLVQKPLIRKILPVSADTFKEITEIDQKANKFFFKKEKQKEGAPAQYIFEPSLNSVFERLAPYLIEIEVYKALLESQASEHSARMLAMKNATDKAEELNSVLQLVYNQARQASITKEIAEISSGTIGVR